MVTLLLSLLEPSHAVCAARLASDPLCQRAKELHLGSHACSSVAGQALPVLSRCAFKFAPCVPTPHVTPSYICPPARDALCITRAPSSAPSPCPSSSRITSASHSACSAVASILGSNWAPGDVPSSVQTCACFCSRHHLHQSNQPTTL